MSKSNSAIDSENRPTPGRSAQQSLWVRVGVWMLNRPVAWIVLLLTLLVTLLAWKNAQEELLQAQQAQFENRAAEVINAVLKRMQSYEQVLRGGVGLFAASKSVERAAWRDYVASLRIQERYPGVQGIGFSVHIPAARLDAHLSTIRAEGFPDYAIRPAGVRAEYTSIIYLEPFDRRNQRAFGFDMFSEATRRAAMERARDIGSTVISSKVTLVQEDGKAVQPGMLMYLPHYKNGAPHNTPEERRANLLGYVYSPFRLNDLMISILEKKQTGAEPDIDIEIYDGTLRAADSLLYDGDGIAHALHGAAPGRLKLTRSIDLYDHTWSLYFTSRPAFHAAFDQNKPLRFLLVGALLSVLLSGLIWMFATQRRRALALANEMNRDLVESETRFRKQSQRLSEVIWGTDIATWEWNVQTGEIVFNERWAEIVGYTLDELAPISINTWSKLVHPDDGKRSGELLTQCFNRESETYICEARMRHKNGEWVWVFDCGRVVEWTEDGKPLRMSGTHQDITERKQAQDEILRLNANLEERVQQRTAALESANKELEAFSYSVSHDLRAPLRSVDSFSRIFLEDYGPKLDDEGKRLLNVVRDEAQRMGRLIDDLLDFSRMNRQEIKAMQCDMTQLAQSVYDSLDESLRSRIQHFNLQPLPPAHGDPAMLRQVLFNLLANAVKFTGHQQAPVIEIGASSAGGMNTYYVKDNGVGFDQRYVHKLFGVFQRLHAENEFEGTGIGLALVQRIIHRLGGTVRAEGKLNAGATFYFTLPIIKEK